MWVDIRQDRQFVSFFRFSWRELQSTYNIQCLMHSFLSMKIMYSFKNGDLLQPERQQLLFWNLHLMFSLRHFMHASKQAGKQPNSISSLHKRRLHALLSAPFCKWQLSHSHYWAHLPEEALLSNLNMNCTERTRSLKKKVRHEQNCPPGHNHFITGIISYIWRKMLHHLWSKVPLNYAQLQKGHTASVTLILLLSSLWFLENF